MILKGRKIFGGNVEGEVLTSPESVSFYGGVEPETGVVVEKGHPIEGQSISGKIFVFPRGKGSTVGSYVLYRLKNVGKAPLAIINEECETIIAVGAIISAIPCIDKIDIKKLRTGSRARVIADESVIEIER